VPDAALLLSIMAGTDPADAATAQADAHRVDYAALAAGALKGKRLGLILPPPDQSSSPTDPALQRALGVLRAQGAEVIEIHDFVRPPDASDDEDTVLKFELKHDMAAYLQSLPGPGPKTLADLIAFNARTSRELTLFNQDYFQMSDAMGDLNDPIYVGARNELVTGSRALLDKTFTQYRVDALIRATTDPSYRIDVVRGDHDGASASFLPATSGYPHLTVPMGYVSGLPVGLSFIGPAWSEARLLAMGAAYETAARARKAPRFLPSLESTPDIAAALTPLPH
jgi:amidase